MSFNSLGISSSLTAILCEMEITQPLPIQELVIPAALDRKNIIATSQTGSGKTLAYLLPVVQHLISAKNKDQRALILAPTRELAQQISNVCHHLCSDSDLTDTIIVGGVDYQPQRDNLKCQPNIIVATPGRLLDLVEQGATDRLQVNYFVLDEVDQMVDLGFRDPIIQLSELRCLGAQSLYFSATMSESVVEIISRLSPDAIELKISDMPLSVSTIDHFGYYVSFEMMDRLLIHLLRSESAQQTIVFTRSRKMADRVVGVLQQNSIVAEAMHSDKSQAAREHILARFRSGETSIIVATDVIARGIDIDSVTHVFNFGLPQSAEQYIHRCGRCGRIGRSGRAISIFTPEERPILNAICRLMKRHIVIDDNHPYLTPDVTRALNDISPRGKRKK